MVVEDNKDGSTVTKKKVQVTQKVVNEVKSGWVGGPGKLQVDKDPSTMELQNCK